MLHCAPMAIDWPHLFESLGGQAVLLAAIAYLIKTIVSNRLTRETEQFKTALQINSNAETERLKNSLQMIALEHQVRFSKLHERRAEVIAELYELLLETEGIARSFVFTGNRDPNEAARARDKVLELYHFIQKRRLYLPTSVCSLLDNFEGRLRSSVNWVGMYWTRIESPNAQTMKDQNEVMLAACNALETDLPALRLLLEAEFRKLLGGEA
jgi:hypothetical protein